MAANSERYGQGDFDVRAFMPNTDLPPLAAQLAPTETASAQATAEPMSEQIAPPIARPQTRVPISIDSIEAWRARQQRDAALRQPQRPPQYETPSGFFVPPAIAPPQERRALPPAPSNAHVTNGRPQLPSAPVPKGLPVGPSGKASKEQIAPQEQKQKPLHLVELVKSRKKATAGALAVAALLVYGANQGSNSLSGGDASAAAMEAEYPTVRNEAINCAAPAFTMAFSGSTKARLPVALKEAGHKDTYLEFDVSGLASTVANICAVRKNNAGQVLATYDGDNDRYTFDRSKIQLNTSEALTNTNNISIVFTGEYVDAKPLTQTDVKKYPFDDATNARLVDLLAVKQDPKTKANVLTPTPQLSRIIRLKMEQLGLAVLQNPDTCANTQVAADQAVNNYVKGQLSRRTPATSKARQVTISGSANYGALTTAFRANKDTAAALDSKLVTLGDLTLNSCDAAPPQATAAPTLTSKKG
jgi:hypothetical protein